MALKLNFNFLKPLQDLDAKIGGLRYFKKKDVAAARQAKHQFSGNPEIQELRLIKPIISKLPSDGQQLKQLNKTITSQLSSDLKALGHPAKEVKDFIDYLVGLNGKQRITLQALYDAGLRPKKAKGIFKSVADSQLSDIVEAVHKLTAIRQKISGSTSFSDAISKRLNDLLSQRNSISITPAYTTFKKKLAKGALFGTGGTLMSTLLGREIYKLFTEPSDGGELGARYSALLQDSDAKDTSGPNGSGSENQEDSKGIGMLTVTGAIGGGALTAIAANKLAAKYAKNYKGLATLAGLLGGSIAGGALGNYADRKLS